jgi:hypothetical protein
MFAEQKLQMEMATVRYIKEKADILVPSVRSGMVLCRAFSIYIRSNPLGIAKGASLLNSNPTEDLSMFIS